MSNLIIVLTCTVSIALGYLIGYFITKSKKANVEKPDIGMSYDIQDIKRRLNDFSASLYEINNLLHQQFRQKPPPELQKRSIETMLTQIDNTAINSINQNIEYLKNEYQKHFKPKTPEEIQQNNEFADKVMKMKERLDVKVKEELNGVK